MYWWRLMLWLLLHRYVVSTKAWNTADALSWALSVWLRNRVAWIDVSCFKLIPLVEVHCIEVTLLLDLRVQHPRVLRLHRLLRLIKALTTLMQRVIAISPSLRWVWWEELLHWTAVATSTVYSVMSIWAHYLASRKWKRGRLRGVVTAEHRGRTTRVRASGRRSTNRRRATWE